MKLSSKASIRADRVKSIYNHLVDWEEMGIEIFQLSKYQYRFIRLEDDHRIDYYPTSGKYYDISLKKWGKSPAYKIIELFRVKNH